MKKNQNKTAFLALAIAAILFVPAYAGVHAAPTTFTNTGGDTFTNTGGDTFTNTGGDTFTNTGVASNQSNPCGPSQSSGSALPGISNPLTACSLEDLLATVVDIAMNIGIVFAVIMIIYAGFKFIWARGNASELEAAKHLFMYVIIGLAILIASKAIVGIIKNSLLQAKVVDPKVFNQSK
ncbi:MAG: hypothetical protein JWO73_41 [Candidatus Taylorbacteria bacterium]|nr:hypothetical protein [Candidatus Taylorbacteria bacterium]